jgi:hypothetical protein
MYRNNDEPSWHQFGDAPLDPPAAGSVAAVVVPARDGFADPPALLVRDDVLAQLGGPEHVRAGGVADLLARIEAAGHQVEKRAVPVPPRRATPAALHREGSGRLWLFRRHPHSFPLPRPRELGAIRFPLLVLGALHSNAHSPVHAARRGAKSSAWTRSSASAARRQTASASIDSVTDRS